MPDPVVTVKMRFEPDMASATEAGRAGARAGQAAMGNVGAGGAAVAAQGPLPQLFYRDLAQAKLFGGVGGAVSFLQQKFEDSRFSPPQQNRIQRMLFQTQTPPDFFSNQRPTGGQQDSHVRALMDYSQSFIPRHAGGRDEGSHVDMFRREQETRATAAGTVQLDSHVSQMRSAKMAALVSEQYDTHVEKFRRALVSAAGSQQFNSHVSQFQSSRAAAMGGQQLDSHVSRLRAMQAANFDADVAGMAPHDAHSALMSRASVESDPMRAAQLRRQAGRFSRKTGLGREVMSTGQYMNVLFGGMEVFHAVNGFNDATTATSPDAAFKGYMGVADSVGGGFLGSFASMIPGVGGMRASATRMAESGSMGDKLTDARRIHAEFIRGVGRDAAVAGSPSEDRRAMMRAGFERDDAQRLARDEGEKVMKAARDKQGADRAVIESEYQNRLQMERGAGMGAPQANFGAADRWRNAQLLSLDTDLARQRGATVGRGENEADAVYLSRIREIERNRQTRQLGVAYNRNIASGMSDFRAGRETLLGQRRIAAMSSDQEGFDEADSALVAGDYQYTFNLRRNVFARGMNAFQQFGQNVDGLRQGRRREAFQQQQLGNLLNNDPEGAAISGVRGGTDQQLESTRFMPWGFRQLAQAGIRKTGEMQEQLVRRDFRVSRYETGESLNAATRQSRFRELGGDYAVDAVLDNVTSATAADARQFMRNGDKDNARRRRQLGVQQVRESRADYYRSVNFEEVEGGFIPTSRNGGFGDVEKKFRNAEDRIAKDADAKPVGGGGTPSSGQLDQVITLLGQFVNKNFRAKAS